VGSCGGPAGLDGLEQVSPAAPTPGDKIMMVPRGRIPVSRPNWAKRYASSIATSAPTPGLPNYGERRRAGEAISTAFTESTVNQVISSGLASP